MRLKLILYTFAGVSIASRTVGRSGCLPASLLEPRKHTIAVALVLFYELSLVFIETSATVSDSLDHEECWPDDTQFGWLTMEA